MLDKVKAVEYDSYMVRFARVVATRYRRRVKYHVPRFKVGGHTAKKDIYDDATGSKATDLVYLDCSTSVAIAHSVNQTMTTINESGKHIGRYRPYYINTYLMFQCK